MADRDTSGTGGPTRKASDSMGQPNAMGQNNNQSSNTQHNSDQHNSNQGNSNQGNSNQGNRNDDWKAGSGRMTDDVNRMAGDMSDQGRQSVSAAQTRIRSLMEQQTHRAADQLGSVAHALHKAAEQLSEENNGTAAHYAVQAADRVEQVADMLRNSTVDDMVGQVERFARRQPEVFVGAAFAVGFLFARFIKSSGERRFQGQSSAGMSARYGHDDHDYGQSGMSRGMGSGTGMNRGMGAGAGGTMGGGVRGDDAGSSSRGMAGGIAGSANTGTGATGTGSGGMGSGSPGTGSMGSNHTTAGTTTPGAGAAASHTNTATAATLSARTRDAAQLMAGGSPEPTPASTSDIGAAKPNQGKTAATVPDATLGVTSATDSKPQATTPGGTGKPQGSSS